MSRIQGVCLRNRKRICPNHSPESGARIDSGTSATSALSSSRVIKRPCDPLRRIRSPRDPACMDEGLDLPAAGRPYPGDRPRCACGRKQYRYHPLWRVRPADETEVSSHDRLYANPSENPRQDATRVISQTPRPSRALKTQVLAAASYNFSEKTLIRRRQRASTPATIIPTASPPSSTNRSRSKDDMSTSNSAASPASITRSISTTPACPTVKRRAGQDLPGQGTLRLAHEPHRQGRRCESLRMSTTI